MGDFNLDLFHTYTEDDGRVEVVDFTDIDNGVGNRVVSIINSLHVSDPTHPRNKRLAAFSKRAAADKVAMGEFESPRRFLMALSKQGKDKIELPCVYITRDPNWVYAEPDKYTDVCGVADLMDGDGNYAGTADYSVVTLSYQVNIVGWQSDNINALATLITQWLRQPNKGHTFKYKTRLAEVNMEMDAHVTDRKMVTVDSASLPFEDDKLRVLSVNITVDAEILSVRYGSEHRAEIRVKGDQYE